MTHINNLDFNLLILLRNKSLNAEGESKRNTVSLIAGGKSQKVALLKP